MEIKGIAWVRLHSAKVHAVHTTHDNMLTLCGYTGNLTYLDNQHAKEEVLCKVCLKSLYAWGFLEHPARMINRVLLVSGVKVIDVSMALKEVGVSPTKENIAAAASYVESVASAHAKAVLQEATKEDWQEWISWFQEQ